MRAQIRKATAAPLELFDLEGFTGDATVTIYNETTVWRAAEVITPSAVSTTASVAAAYRASSVDVVSAVGFARGMRAVVTPASGVKFPIQILGVEGNTLHIETPLRAALAIGATISLNIAASALTGVDTASNARDLRAFWTYTNGLGEARSLSEYFDVVTDPWQPQITEEMLRREDSTISEYLGKNVTVKESAQGAQDETESFLRSRGKYPDLYRFRDDLNRAVSLLAISRIKAANKNYDAANLYQKKGDIALTRIEASKDWYDLDDDLSKGALIDGGTYDTSTGGLPRYSEQRSPVNYARVI